METLFEYTIHETRNYIQVVFLCSSMLPKDNPNTQKIIQRSKQMKEDLENMEDLYNLILNKITYDPVILECNNLINLLSSRVQWDVDKSLNDRGNNEIEPDSLIIDLRYINHILNGFVRYFKGKYHDDPRGKIAISSSVIFILYFEGADTEALLSQLNILHKNELINRFPDTSLSYRFLKMINGEITIENGNIMITVPQIYEVSKN